jgi:hypothetical protein
MTIKLQYFGTLCLWTFAPEQWLPRLFSRHVISRISLYRHFLPLHPVALEWVVPCFEVRGALPPPVISVTNNVASLSHLSRLLLGGRETAAQSP